MLIQKTTAKLSTLLIYFSLCCLLITPTQTQAECVDADGDGYGWNGQRACKTRRVRNINVQNQNLRIISNSIVDIQKDSVRIIAKFNQPAVGRVEFGTDTNFGKYGPYHGTLRKSDFNQKLYPLKPGTKYFYRIMARKGSEMVFSTTGQFTTAPGNVAPPTTTTTTSTTLKASTTTTSSSTTTTTPASGNGKLWGVTHGTTNNTNQFLGKDSSNKKAQKRHAIPFVSIHNTITALQINLRADNQTSRLGHYTRGNGGTIRVLLVGDRNCSPDMSNVLFTGQESVGDMSMWKNENEFLKKYPGAVWDDDSATHTMSINGQRHYGSTSVTKGQRYWLVAEHVRGGISNYPSINYFRSANSDDYARNWLTRTQDPSADSQCMLPMVQNDDDSWENLKRHPIYTVEGNNGIQGVPYYNQGTAPDDEPGKDRYSNVNSGDSIRNIWTVPGTKTIDKVHLCMMRQSGSGEVQLRIDGNLVATWDASDFPTKVTEEYPATFEAARWRSADITPVTLSGTAVFEVTVTGSADMEMGSIKEGRIFVPLQVGTNGTPDILSEYSLNGGSWKVPDLGRIKYSIGYNEQM